VLPGPLVRPLVTAGDGCDPNSNTSSHRRFPVMQYSEAMARYGTDKPDTRLGLELVTVSEEARRALLAEAGVESPSNSPLAMHALVVPGLGKLQSKKECAKMVKWAWDQLPNSPAAAGGTDLFGLVAVSVNAEGQWGRAVMQGSVVKQLFAGKATSHVAREELLSNELGARPGDLVVIALSYGDRSNRNDHCWALGACRTSCAKESHKQGLLAEPDRKDVSMLWVVNFPLFENDNTIRTPSGDVPGRVEYGLKSVHHPFTAPVDEDAHLLGEGATREDLLSVRGQHYDLVCNGVEVGGGSLRIHDPLQQRWVLESVLGLDGTRTKYFDHLLGALGSGCPNHGGIALGLDRYVCMYVCMYVCISTSTLRRRIRGSKAIQHSHT
jgi:aspartyl-tRNA synthetase